MLASPLWQAG